MSDAKPRSGWQSYRNLGRRPAKPALGNGRIQKAIRRCFYFHADADGVVDRGTIQRFCQEWRWQCQGYRPSPLNRLNVLHALRQVAEPIGRSKLPGRPMLWRLKQPGAEMSSAPPD